MWFFFLTDISKELKERKETDKEERKTKGIFHSLKLGETKQTFTNTPFSSIMRILSDMRKSFPLPAPANPLFSHANISQLTLIDCVHGDYRITLLGNGRLRKYIILGFHVITHRERKYSLLESFECSCGRLSPKPNLSFPSFPMCMLFLSLRGRISFFSWSM